MNKKTKQLLIRKKKEQTKRKRRSKLRRHSRSENAKSTSVIAVQGRTDIDNNTVPKKLSKKKDQKDAITSLWSQLNNNNIIVQKTKAQREELIRLHKRRKSIGYQTITL